MVLFRDFGWLDAAFLLLFVACYALYAMRIARAGRRLGGGLARVLPKLIIRSLAFLLLAFSFLGPSFGEQKREVVSQGKDIFLAIDLSRSMDAIDVKPSRLAKIKIELSKIVEAFSSDRLGLIIFTSEAFMQCPLTFDHAALQTLFINPLNTNLISNTGTDFAPPLRMALEKFAETGDSKQGARKQSSKIIVLVSDGEDFGDETSSVAGDIKDQGIRLFALGVGTQEGGRIPELHGMKRDQSGNEVVTTLNPNALKSLAEETGGKYFEIGKDRNDTSKLIAAIERIEGEVRDAQLMDASANKYYYFLGAALALLILDVLLTVRTLKLA